MRATLAFLLAGLFAAFASIGPAGAQSDVDVRESSARSDFPNGIVFTLEAASSADLDHVALVYETPPDGRRATSVARVGSTGWGERVMVGALACGGGGSSGKPA